MYWGQEEGKKEGCSRSMVLCWNRSTNLDNSRSRPSVLALGVGGIVWIFLLLFLSLEDGSIQTDILSERVVTLKTANQPSFR